MKLSKLVPPPFREFLRQRLTVYVYTYGFRPSRSISEQTFTFTDSGRSFNVKADHRKNSGNEKRGKKKEMA